MWISWNPNVSTDIYNGAVAKSWSVTETGFISPLAVSKAAFKPNQQFGDPGTTEPRAFLQDVSCLYPCCKTFSVFFLWFYTFRFSFPLVWLALNFSTCSISVIILSQCGRNEKLIEQTFRMVERALSLASGDSDLATELGYQMVLLGRTKEAMKWYKTAMTLDETSVAALTGIVLQFLIHIVYIALRRHTYTFYF